MARAYRVALYLNMNTLHQQGIAYGVIRYARMRQNWRLFGTYWPLYQVEDFASWDGDGIIAAVESLQDIEMLTRPGVPVVDTSGAIAHPALSVVTADNEPIGRIGGGHLADNGFEHFAFCAADGSLWSEERLWGFEKATFPVRTGAVAVFRRPKTWWHRPEFSRELADFLAARKRPLGVMAANDIIAMNVIGACRLAKLRVPKDVALVGVDNEELWCELSNPPISSIAFDRDAIGFHAAERLDALMRGLIGAMPPLRIPPPPLALTERASSAVLAVSDPLVAEALAFIRKNAVDNLGAGEVADKLFTSRRNLERRFRRQVGHTILEEIHRARVKHAKRLLLESDLPATRVAMASGFKNLDRFVSVFTRYAGMSPRSYRAEHGAARK